MKFNLGNIKVNGSPLAYFVELSIFLFVLWLMLSGRTEARFLVMGAGFSLLTAYICAPFLIVRNKKTEGENLYDTRKRNTKISQVNRK